MKFSEVVEQASALLQRKGRITYRALQREFTLDDEALADLKDELLFVHAEHAREEGLGLVWIGVPAKPEPENRGIGEPEQRPTPSPPQSLVSSSQNPAAERRQITVLFCDLVGSTALSAQLDPEDYRAVVQAYQATATAVIEQHQGYLAQHWGDGLLVYFGYPAAQEDDARRAVRTGLEIIQAVQKIVPVAPFHTLPHEPKGLQVRIGVHTGLVVIGEIGGGEKKELLALGETPNLAARIQSLAEPNTMLMSAATHKLVEQQFENQSFGSHLVRGFSTPIAVYQVQSERPYVSLLVGKATLTPLVGREQEVGLLLDRWEQTKEGRGQVMLLSGEPGIGKSRLAHTLKEHVANEGSLFYEARCSPYHQQSALYPLIDSLQRTLLFTRQDADEEKVAKLERALALYEMPDTLPLFTALLSLPIPSQYPPLNLTPQKQKERTLHALVQMLTAQAERQATVFVWEDLHWVDPSSLEFLSLLIEQIPTTKLFLMLTFRPEFIPPWKPRSHISQLVLNRLGKKQVEAMIEKAAGGKALPAEVIAQIQVKTDGVPLFVEEVTKSVVESVGATGRTPLQLAIPATLQEALLARLDRLSDTRQVAQLGATLGREFSYELLHAVSPLNNTDLQSALTKLVEAEILYQRGVGEQTIYFFKHALIQDTAYQSLLKSTRQQYHQQIARVLEERFPDTKEMQPELLAHHYTEANLIEQAIPYWRKAGQKAIQRSANTEAINYLTKGLALLKTLPDTPEHAQQELTLQITLGPPLMATKGWVAPEVERVYTRARELCRQVGETPQLFPVLEGLAGFYVMRAELQTAQELEEQCLGLAQRTQDLALLVEAHHLRGCNSFYRGGLATAHAHLEQAVVFYDPRQHNSHTFLYGHDPGVCCLAFDAFALWFLGCPNQALEKMRQALSLARDLSHPLNLALALYYDAWFYQYCRETQAVQKQAETCIALCTEHGFPFSPLGTMLQGWALTEQEQREEGVVQIRQGLAICQSVGAKLWRPYYLVLLAEALEKIGRAEEGLSVLTEALEIVQRTGERFYEAELHRLKGELTLQKGTRGWGLETSPPSAQASSLKPLAPGEAEAEAESCFLKALEVSRNQKAKSLELRATMSLVRLRQQQATRYGSRNTHHETRVKLDEARQMLSDVYNWFTEGFDTKDLQEAKALLDSLGSGV